MAIKKKNPRIPVPLAIGFIAVILTLTLIVAKKHLFIPSDSKGHQIEIPETQSLTAKVPVNLKKKNDEVGSVTSSEGQLVKKIERLESKVARIKANQHVGVESDPISNFEEDYEDRMEAIEAQAAGQIQEQVALINHTLQSENPDDQWSESAVNDVYESFEVNSGNGYQVLDADCRSTMCRVELVIPGDSSEDSFTELGDSLPWNGEMFFQVEDPESGEAVVYLAREDHSLPRLTE